VVASGCWLQTFIRINGGFGPLTAGTGARRANDTDFGSCATFDSDGTVGTGSQFVTVNWVTTQATATDALTISMSPAGEGGGGTPLKRNAALNGLSASGPFFRDPLAGYHKAERERRQTFCEQVRRAA
jgi:hypothetical protein